MSKCLLCFDSAIARLINSLNLKDPKFTNSCYVNNKRYGIISSEVEKCLVLFKRDFFMKFGDQYKDQGESGVGESINSDALKMCFRLGIKRIFFCYEDGRVYFISPVKVAEIGHKRQTLAESKEVYSFSVNHLINYAP